MFRGREKNSAKCWAVLRSTNSTTKKINVNFWELLRGRVTNRRTWAPTSKGKKKQKQTKKRKTENKKSPGNPCPQQKANKVVRKIRRRNPTSSWRKGARR